MDGQGFDRFARLLGSGMSRRQVVRTLAAGTGASVLAAVGLGPAVSDSLAATTKLRLARSPRVTFDGLDAIVSVQPSQIASCVVEYGPTKALGTTISSNGMARSHQIRIKGLAPKTRYYFRVTLQTEEATATSGFYNFRTPSCPAGTALCGGACMTACGSHAALDKGSCACVCSAGFADCGGDGSCETKLGTVDNCLACGNACDDGNACTDNACDPNAGCVTMNLADGTPCGTNGTCVNGACQSCVAGGNCGADSECCDDEACCGGACVAKTALLADAANCGKCGNACAAGPCQAAVCVDGACQTEPGSDDEACDDGNPCTEHDHCMSGMCMGSPVADGTPCGDAATCQDGICVTCKAGGQCATDAECCADEACCNGTCVASSSFDSDPANCGACGHACDDVGVCGQAVCAQGLCGAKPATDGTPCDVDNPCLKQTACKSGICDGDRVADGTACGTAGTCQLGQCVESAPIGSAATGPLFADDFELGNLSKWTSTSGMKVQKSIVAAGTYAARATGSGSAAYARKSLSPAQTDLAFRTRFQLVSQGNNAVNLLRVYKSATSVLAAAYVAANGKLAVSTAAGNTASSAATSATVISQGQWYELQLRVKVAGASSTVEVWLNGTKVADLSLTVNLGTTGISQIQLGESVTGRTFDVVFDDVAVCTGGLCDALGAPAPKIGGTSTSPGAASGVLMATYAFNTSTGAGVNWAKVAYRPRQFKAGLVIDDPTWGAQTVDGVGAYDGWDVFPTYNSSVHRIETRADWTQFELNRAAVLAVVWRDASPVPTWLNSWTKAGNVTLSGRTFPTYRKSVGAGTVTLGAVYNPTDSPGPNATRDTYWVLLAEADALPSPAPTVPAGKDVPAPNATCPTWVHDQYVATGPDGQTYATWHHQIDPVYWCYHRHEHGTNPFWFASDRKPVFGYVAAKHGMSEPHAGFKNLVFDSDDGSKWMVTHHFGTAGLGRACTRYHTVDLAVIKRATGELLADLHFMGDFGVSVVNSTHVALTPPSCPDQAAQAAGSTGVRMIPSQADGAVGYEPWRVDLSKTVFGFVGDFTINNPDGIVICNNSTCDQAASTGKSGTFRFFTANQSSRNQPLGVSAGAASGTFYTDPLGTKLVAATDPGAVQQYLKPGISFQALVSGHCYDVYAWGGKLVCGASNAEPTDREDSIQAPN